MSSFKANPPRVIRRDIDRLMREAPNDTTTRIVEHYIRWPWYDRLRIGAFIATGGNRWLSWVIVAAFVLVTIWNGWQILH